MENKITILVVMLLVVVALGSGCVEDGGDSNTDNGITAMEGKEITDRIAYNWTPDAKLIGIHKGDEMVSPGKCLMWFFYYYNSSNQSLPYHYIKIEMYSNGDAISIVLNNWWFTNKSKPIENWTIDSEDAYNIAINNNEIKKWLEINDKAKVEGFHLVNSYDNYTNPRWVIQIDNYEKGNDGIFATIDIDAITGEVLEVITTD